MNDDNVIATIYHVYKKQRWRSGDTIMLMQPIEIVTEQTNEFISLDASEITHLFWDRLTDKRSFQLDDFVYYFTVKFL